jgi:hypothetical protein
MSTGLDDPLTDLVGERSSSSEGKGPDVEYTPFVLRLVEIMEILLEKTGGM